MSFSRSGGLFTKLPAGFYTFSCVNKPRKLKNIGAEIRLGRKSKKYELYFCRKIIDKANSMNSMSRGSFSQYKFKWKGAVLPSFSTLHSLVSTRTCRLPLCVIVRNIKKVLKRPFRVLVCSIATAKPQLFKLFVQFATTS